VSSISCYSSTTKHTTQQYSMVYINWSTHNMSLPKNLERYHLVMRTQLANNLITFSTRCAELQRRVWCTEGVSRLYDVYYHYTEYLYGNWFHALAAFILHDWEIIVFCHLLRECCIPPMLVQLALLLFSLLLGECCIPSIMHMKKTLQKIELEICMNRII
jgi:hypothetical protein